MCRKDLCTPGDSSSVQQGSGAGHGANRKEEHKLTHEQGQRHRSKGEKEIKNVNQESEKGGRKRG